jgi:Mg/Co/Ni transporter MgtE
MMHQRYRRQSGGADVNVEGGMLDLTVRNQELEELVKNLRSLLDVSRMREKTLAKALLDAGIMVNLEADGSINTGNKDDNASIVKSLLTGSDPVEPKQTFFDNLKERGVWLIGLLLVQSCSSFILAFNEKLLQNHPTVIYFLTMLVGSGGNCGNQASVKCIKGLAIGALKSKKSIITFLIRELFMAIALSFLLGTVGFIRALLTSQQTSYQEIMGITGSLIVIVFFSIVIGSILPIILLAYSFDPAHASTSIQVIMDISGVLITCFVSSCIFSL